MTSRSSQNPPVYTLPQHGVSAKAFKGKRQLRQSSVTVPRQEQSSVRTGRGRGERRGHTAVKVCDVLRAGQAGNRQPARRPLVTGHWSPACALTGRNLPLRLATGSGFPDTDCPGCISSYATLPLKRQGPVAAEAHRAAQSPHALPSESAPGLARGRTEAQAGRAGRGAPAAVRRRGLAGGAEAARRRARVGTRAPWQRVVSAIQLFLFRICVLIGNSPPIKGPFEDSRFLNANMET